MDPAERLPAPQELYKAALKCFSQITIDTILARCLVMFFLGDYMKMDEHAVTALQIADNIRDKANCVRCYYISGVALWNQGEEHYDKAYEAFSSAKDCPGSYKISDRNAQDWKRIVNAALRQTPRRANYAPVTTTWADSYNNDFISALGRRNSARVPVDPELPTAAPPASRPWSEAEFETANLRFQARHAASEPYDPRNLSDPAPPRPRPWSQREIMSAEFVDRARHAALEPNDPGNLPLPESLPSESDGTVRRVSLIDHTSMVNEPPTTTTTDRNPSAPSWSPHHQRNSPIAGGSPFGSPPSHASRSPRTMHSTKSPLSFHSQTQAERDSQLGAFGISDEFSPVSGQSPNDASWQPYDQGGSPQLGGLNVRTMSEGATARWRETSAIMAREAKERYALENAMTVDRAAELGGLGFTPVFGMSPGLSPPGQMSAGFSLGSPALGPESPGSPENGSPDRLSPRDEHQRGRLVAFNSEVQAFSAPSSVAGSSLRPPSPASSVGSVGSVRSISSNRSRRPELLPITIPQPKARRTTIAFAKPASPDRRPSGPIMSAVDGVGAGSIPRSAAGSYKGFGEGSMPRSAVGNFRGLIEGSYRSTIADQMLGNGTPLRSASVSPASAYFEGLVQNQFGGQGGEARDSPVDSPTQARGRGQGQGRGRGRGRGMQRVPSYSAGTAQRNVWAGYQKQMEEEAKKEGEGEGEGVESTDLDDELAKRTARAARYNFEESCERTEARGRRRGRGRGLVQMPPDPEDTVGEKNGFKFSDIARSMQDGGRRGFQRSGEEIAGEQHRRDWKWGSRPAEEPSISEEDEEEDGEENEEEGDEREKWEERRRRKKEEITREDGEEIESTVSNKDDFDYSRGSSNTDKNEDEGEGGKNGEE